MSSSCMYWCKCSLLCIIPPKCSQTGYRIRSSQYSLYNSDKEQSAVFISSTGSSFGLPLTCCLLPREGLLWSSTPSWEDQAIAVGIYKPYCKASARRGVEWCSQTTVSHQALRFFVGRWSLGFIQHKLNSGPLWPLWVPQAGTCRSPEERTGLNMVMNNWRKDRKWKILNSVLRSTKDCIQKGEIKCQSTRWKATDCRGHPWERAFTCALLFAARFRCDLTPLLSSGMYWFRQLQKSCHSIMY